MKPRFFFILLALVFATAFLSCSDERPNPVQVASPDAPAVNVHTGPWQMLAPVPANGRGVEGMSVACLGNQIIAALGYDGFNTATTRIYDIDTDTWSFGADAPGASAEGVGLAHGGLFYNVGGREAAANALWSYDPTTDMWNAGLAPMPTARQGLAAAVVGNAIYAIGGREVGGPNGPGKLDAVERYDIDTDTWTSVAPLPAPRSDMAAATVGNKVYVFGGFDARGNVLNDVDMYDPVKDTWTTGFAPMPTARGAMYGVATKGGEVYVIGGWDGIGNGLATNEAYKVAQDTWTAGLPLMPTARAEAGACGHGGRIYIVGGATPGFGASVDANEVFKPSGVGGGPPTPMLSVFPAVLDFGDSTVQLTFDIANVGGGTLNWSIGGGLPTWLSANPTAGSGDATITVDVDRTGLSSGNYMAQIMITSDGGNGMVTVNMTVPGPPPLLSVSPRWPIFSSVISAVEC
jgi:hypothetical protein